MIGTAHGPSMPDLSETRYLASSLYPDLFGSKTTISPSLLHSTRTLPALRTLPHSPWAVLSFQSMLPVWASMQNSVVFPPPVRPKSKPSLSTGVLYLLAASDFFQASTAAKPSPFFSILYATVEP